MLSLQKKSLIVLTWFPWNYWKKWREHSSACWINFNELRECLFRS